MYLTDEVFLYRLVDVVVTEADVMADVEDCHGLDMVRVRFEPCRRVVFVS